MDRTGYVKGKNYKDFDVYVCQDMTILKISLCFIISELLLIAEKLH